MHAPKRKQPPLANGPGWYFFMLCMLCSLVRFNGTLRWIAETAHSKQMYLDGIVLRQQLFSQPASDHNNMHAVVLETTTSALERSSASPVPILKMVCFGSDFSARNGPVRFGSEPRACDAAAGDIGDGDESNRRRRSIQCQGCGRHFVTTQALCGHSVSCEVEPPGEPEEPKQSDAVTQMVIWKRVCKISSLASLRRLLT